MSGSMAEGGQPSGPPYASPRAALGGLPTNKIDTPIAAVFMFCYMCAAAGHMTLLQLNLRRKHKFLLSGVMFGYCMSRIVTMIMRIVWANYPHSVRVAIAANIFTAAGVLLLFVINLIFAQRIIRATHPTWGWSRPFHYGFMALWVLIPLVLAMNITAIVQMSYTLDMHIQTIDRDMAQSGSTFLTFVAFLPFPLMAINYALPRRPGWETEAFGKGSIRIRVAALMVATTLLVLGAGFRLGIGWQDYYHPRPRNNPGWYHSKACYWIFDIAVEITVVYLYLILRVDLRFHIPNGSKGPGDYSRKQVGEDETDLEGMGEEGREVMKAG